MTAREGGAADQGPEVGLEPGGSGGQNNLRPTVDWSVAGASAVMLIGAFLVAGVLSVLLPGADPARFNPLHSSLYVFEDTRLQRYTYDLWLVGTFLVFIAFGLLARPIPRLPGWHNPGRALRIGGGGAALAVVVAAVGWFDATRLSDPSFVWPAAVFAVAMPLLVGLVGTSASRIVTPVALTAVAGALIGLLVVPLFATFTLPTFLTWGTDHHWSGVIGSGMLGAVFPDAMRDAAPEYGLGLNMLVQGWTALGIEAPLAGGITIMQLANVACAAAILATTWQRASRNRVIGAALGLLVIATFWQHLSGWAIHMITPNQVGLRFLGIFLCVALAPWILRQTVAVAAAGSAVLAVTCGFYNTESGVVCLLGLGFALLIRIGPRGIGTWIVAAVAFSVAFAVALIGGGYVLLGLDAARVSTLIGMFSGGYGGIRMDLFVPFLVMMAHVGYLFALRLARLRRPENAEDLQGAVIVGILVAFAPYVVNRFDAQNMWVPLVLYCLLMASSFQAGSWGRAAGVAAYLLVVILPIHGHTAVQNAVYNRQVFWEQSPDDGERCLLGMDAELALCRFLTGKGAALRALLDDEGGVVWISGTPLTVSLHAGVPPSTPIIDGFAFARDAEHDQAFVDLLRDRAPRMVLIDPPNGPDVPFDLPPAVLDWQTGVVGDLGYTITRETPYWRIATKDDGGTPQ